MKNILFLLVIFLSFNTVSFAQEPLTGSVEMTEAFVFTQKDKFGLKDKQDNIVLPAEYKKLIRVNGATWIAQKKNKFGIADNSGNFIVKPKYRHADRLIGRYVKLGNDKDYGLYDETGKKILPHEYSKIDLLFGGMFLTYKNYKYGVVDFNGNTILDNRFDDIYMPKSNIMRIQYEGQWYEIERLASEDLLLPDDITSVKTDKNFKVTHLFTDTGLVSGYSVLTFTDYFIKIFSSISPAHEETIDELMFSNGADTVPILMKFTWVPRYPFTFVKLYCRNVRNPNNGPLIDVRNDLKKKINE